MIVTIAILIIGYPFFLYFKLNSFKTKLYASCQELEALLKEHNNEASEELAESIHRKRRAYNAVVRANNHKVDSKLGRFLAKRYDFSTQDFFEFQGR
jgi:hypothetical protein